MYHLEDIKKQPPKAVPTTAAQPSLYAVTTIYISTHYTAIHTTEQKEIDR